MTPRLLVLILFVTGLGLYFYSLTLPYYKDAEAAQNLISRSYGTDKSEYYKTEAELRTKKLTYLDLGSGLLIASGIVLLFLLTKEIKGWSDFKRVKTPGKIALFLLSNVAWLMLIPGTFWYYSYRAGRGDYPPFADSIGIPIYQTIPTLLLGLLLLNVFLVFSFIGAELPAQLFVRACNRKSEVILWEIFFGFWLVLNNLMLVEFVIDGDHITIPVNLFFTFVLLSLRAGQISRYKETESQ